MNLARNIGGSCGTSFFVTLLARRSQEHQDRLSMFLNGISPQFIRQRDALARYFQHGGGLTASPAQARALAQGSLYQQLIRQSTQLAYLDVVAILVPRRRLHDPLHLPDEKTQGRPCRRALIPPSSPEGNPD